jgi:hypothetical protein
VADAFGAGTTDVLSASTPLALTKRKTFVQTQSAPLTVPADAQAEFKTSLVSQPGSIWRLAQPAATVLLTAQATQTPVILQQSRTTEAFALSDPFKDAPAAPAPPAPAPATEKASVPDTNTSPDRNASSLLDISA